MNISSKRILSRLSDLSVSSYSVSSFQPFIQIYGDLWYLYVFLADVGLGLIIKKNQEGGAPAQDEVI